MRPHQQKKRLMTTRIGISWTMSWHERVSGLNGRSGYMDALLDHLSSIMLNRLSQRFFPCYTRIKTRGSTFPFSFHIGSMCLVKSYEKERTKTSLKNSA